MKRRLLSIYRKLHGRFGPQDWWPADTAFEVVVGAILTQNTAWSNVEKAIYNLKKSGRLTPKTLSNTNTATLARLIRPSGYYNIKARRLKNFVNFLNCRFNGSLRKMFSAGQKELRGMLLGINGIGQETADSILLYAADKPVFVVDAYTKRILSRHGFISGELPYEGVQALFMENLPRSTRLFNEFHALIVKTGKDLCRKTRPKCDKCPLNKLKTAGGRG